MATEVPEDKVDLVAKEIELTRLLLASISAETRDDGIAQIKRLLLKHSGDTSDAFQLNDYLMIWRGLIDFMSMSDKLLLQDSAEKISFLIYSCTSYQGKIFFLNALFITINDECMSISQHHIDKYMMLVRLCLRQLLLTFVNCDCNLENMIKLSEVLYRAFKSFTLRLRTHLKDIFLEELVKVGRRKVPFESLIIMLDSFLHYISELNDFMLIKEVTQNVFINLLYQQPDFKMLEAKFQDWRKIGEQSRSYNNMVEGEIADDWRCAENLNVEIPCIKFNLKDLNASHNSWLVSADYGESVSKKASPLVPAGFKVEVLETPKKTLTKVQKKVSTPSLKFLTNDSSPKESNSNKHKSESIILKINDRSNKNNIKKQNSPFIKIGASNALNSSHNSWSVSVDYGESVSKKASPLVPAGFKVEVLETPEKPTIKVQKKVSTPSLKSLTNDSNKHKSESIILKINDRSNKNNIKKQNSPFIKIGTSNALNSSHNSWSVSVDYGESVSKKASPLVPAGFKVEVLETPEKPTIKVQKKVSTPSLKSLTNDSSPKESNSNKHKSESIILKINDRSNKNNIKKQNSPFIKIGASNALNSSHNSWSVSADYGESVSKKTSLLVPAGFKVEVLETPEKPTIKVQEKVSTPNSKYVTVDSSNEIEIDSKSNRLCKEEKHISSTSVITPDKNFKSPESPKSPTFEQRVLRRRTIIISKKIPDGENEGSPKRKVQETSALKVLQKWRKTIAEEEINMLKPKEILKKAHENVRSEAFEDGFGSLRRSPRMSIKPDFYHC